MTKNFSLGPFIIIILIILGGLSLLIFRGSVLEILRRKTGVNPAIQVENISAAMVTVASTSALDTSILKLPRFTALVNQVTNFDFANICWRPEVTVSQTAASQALVELEGEVPNLTEAAVVHCVQGNDLPFNAKKK